MLKFRSVMCQNGDAGHFLGHGSPGGWTCAPDCGGEAGLPVPRRECALGLTCLSLQQRLLLTEPGPGSWG